MIRALLILCLLLITPHYAQSQLQVTRNAVLDPFTTTSDTDGLFIHTGILAELNKGFGSTNGAQAWNTKICGMFEIYRWDTVAALTILVGNEMAAGDRNDLGFDPQSARWEEALVFSHSPGPFTWQLAAIQQCKHDIDNSDPLNSDEPNASSVHKRVAILTGFYGSILFPSAEPLPGVSFDGYLRFDYYPSSSDYRFPGNDVGKNWDDIVGYGSVGIRASAALTDRIALYCKGWGAYSLPSPTFYDGLNYHAELGARFGGKGGSFLLYSALERYFDDLSRPLPQSSEVLYIGIRAVDTLFR